jgi:hypothetical protein
MALHEVTVRRRKNGRMALHEATKRTGDEIAGVTRSANILVKSCLSSRYIPVTRDAPAQNGQQSSALRVRPDNRMKRPVNYGSLSVLLGLWLESNSREERNVSCMTGGIPIVINFTEDYESFYLYSKSAGRFRRVNGPQPQQAQGEAIYL